MRPTTKTAIAAVSLVALLGVGAASAFGGFGGRAVDEHCTDDMTVGDCKEAIRSARDDAHWARCVEAYDESFCTDLFALKDEHKAETKALLDAYGIEGRPHVEPERPDERPCNDEMTIAECREAIATARETAWTEACTEAYGAEFCDAWKTLKAEHKAELDRLFEAAGYERPAPGHDRPTDRPGPQRPQRG